MEIKLVPLHHGHLDQVKVPNHGHFDQVNATNRGRLDKVKAADYQHIAKFPWQLAA